jgi:predicted alpha-1,6-mannanase (GH76 family)
VIATLAVNGILVEPGEPELGNDGPQFKGIFIRNLRVLYDATREPRYRDFIIASAESIWSRSRGYSDFLGGRWTGPFDKADAARQSSALDALNAAIAVST